MNFYAPVNPGSWNSGARPCAARKAVLAAGRWEPRAPPASRPWWGLAVPALAWVLPKMRERQSPRLRGRLERWLWAAFGAQGSGVSPLLSEAGWSTGAVCVCVLVPSRDFPGVKSSIKIQGQENSFLKINKIGLSALVNLPSGASE